MVSKIISIINTDVTMQHNLETQYESEFSLVKRSLMKMVKLLVSKIYFVCLG